MPRPRDAVPLVVDALRSVFGADLRGAILKGSVLKGDSIPYFSDLDVHAFVACVGPDRSVDWPLAVALQERIGKIEPDDYEIGYVQLLLFDPDGYPADFAVPPRGTYEVLYGEPPASFARAPVAASLEIAAANLRRLPEHIATLNRSFSDKADAHAPRIVRLAGAYLKGGLYDAASLITNDPATALSRRLADLVALVGPVVGNETDLRAYYDLARRWRDLRSRPDELRAMYGHGMAALQKLAAWRR